jgi:translation elongation factor P/translation initiation factor 5A
MKYVKLNEIRDGEFFYLHNKRYRIEDHPIRKNGKISVINSNGRTVFVKVNQTVKVFS